MTSLESRKPARLPAFGANIVANAIGGPGGDLDRAVLDALPIAIYTTDPNGIITYYNPAAAELAGRKPEIGRDKWCVSWRLYNPDGSPLPHDQCPMALTLREKRAVRGVEAIAERPDATGELIGAVNMLVDVSRDKEEQVAVRAQGEKIASLSRARHQLAAIVESS